MAGETIRDVTIRVSLKTDATGFKPPDMKKVANDVESVSKTVQQSAKITAEVRVKFLKDTERVAKSIAERQAERAENAVKEAKKAAKQQAKAVKELEEAQFKLGDSYVTVGEGIMTSAKAAAVLFADTEEDLSKLNAKLAQVQAVFNLFHGSWKIVKGLTEAQRALTTASAATELVNKGVAGSNVAVASTSTAASGGIRSMNAALLANPALLAAVAFAAGAVALALKFWGDTADDVERVNEKLREQERLEKEAAKRRRETARETADAAIRSLDEKEKLHKRIDELNGGVSFRVQEQRINESKEKRRSFLLEDPISAEQRFIREQQELLKPIPIPKAPSDLSPRERFHFRRQAEAITERMQRHFDETRRPRIERDIADSQRRLEALQSKEDLRKILPKERERLSKDIRDAPKIPGLKNRIKEIDVPFLEQSIKLLNEIAAKEQQRADAIRAQRVEAERTLEADKQRLETIKDSVAQLQQRNRTIEERLGRLLTEEGPEAASQFGKVLDEFRRIGPEGLAAQGQRGAEKARQIEEILGTGVESAFFQRVGEQHPDLLAKAGAAVSVGKDDQQRTLFGATIVGKGSDLEASLELLRTAREEIPKVAAELRADIAKFNEQEETTLQEIAEIMRERFLTESALEKLRDELQAIKGQKPKDVAADPTRG